MVSLIIHKRAIRIANACSAALLSVLAISTDVCADAPGPAWKTETLIYLTGMTDYLKKNNASVTYKTLATAAEIRFSSDTRRWYASLFGDYRYSSDKRFTDKVKLGGLINYNWHKWDATTYVLINKTPGASGTWLYAGRLRYRASENHKLGIEAVASFKHPSSVELMFGYYGTISDSFSLNALVGPGIADGPDLNARLELTWQAH